MELTARATRPSIAFGARLALRLWRLVLVSWLVQLGWVLPALIILQRGLLDGLGRLPADLAEGELVLIVVENLERTGGPLAAALLVAAGAVWAWTVLWHAAVVCWRVWSEASAPRIFTLVGLGLILAGSFLAAEGRFPWQPRTVQVPPEPLRRSA